MRERVRAGQDQRLGRAVVARRDAGPRHGAGQQIAVAREGAAGDRYRRAREGRAVRVHDRRARRQRRRRAGDDGHRGGDAEGRRSVGHGVSWWLIVEGGDRDGDGRGLGGAAGRIGRVGEGVGAVVVGDRRVGARSVVVADAAAGSVDPAGACADGVAFASRAAPAVGFARPVAAESRSRWCRSWQARRWSDHSWQNPPCVSACLRPHRRVMVVSLRA